MKITLNDFESNGGAKPEPQQNLVIFRQNDDLSKKMTEHEFSELKIGLKLFLNSDNQESLRKALENGKLLVIN